MSFLDYLIARWRYRKIELILRNKKNLLILDAGGGDGFLRDILKRRGHRVIVFDLNDKADVRGDLNFPLPFKDKVFDVVVSCAVLEHLEKPHLALEEFKRVGKSVVITTPSPYARIILEFLARKGFINLDHVRDHKCYLGRKEIEKHGYKVKYFEGIFNQLGFYNVSLPSSFPVWFVVFLVGLRFLLFPSFPRDDLLRHLVAYLYNYD